MKRMEQGYRNSQSTTVLSASWAMTVEETIKQLQVFRQEGLDRREVQHRLKKHGPNRLRETEKKSIIQIFINQLKSLIVILLGVAAVLSFVFNEWVNGIAIRCIGRPAWPPEDNDPFFFIIHYIIHNFRSECTNLATVFGHVLLFYRRSVSNRNAQSNNI